jgi:hypothetical protein
LKIWAHFNISEECSPRIFNYSSLLSSFPLYIIACVVFCSREILSYSMLPKSDILYKNPFIFMYFIISFPVYSVEFARGLRPRSSVLVSSRLVYHEILNPVGHYWFCWMLAGVWVEIWKMVFIFPQKIFFEDL